MALGKALERAAAEAKEGPRRAATIGSSSQVRPATEAAGALPSLRRFASV